MPFWIHQVIEYVIGVLLVAQALQTDRPLVPLVAGMLVLGLAATADGPIGAFRVVRRPLHKVLDVVIGTGLIVFAVVARDSTSSAGTLVALVGGAAVLALAVRTERARPPRRSAPTSATAPPMAPMAPSATTLPPVAPAASVPPSAPPASGTEAISRRAGRALGKGIRTFRDDPR